MGSNKVLFTTTGEEGLKTYYIADAGRAEIVRLFDGQEYAALAARFTGKEVDPMQADFQVQRQDQESGKLLCSVEGKNGVFDPETLTFSEVDPVSATGPSRGNAYNHPLWKRYTRDGAFAIYAQKHNLMLYKANHAGADSLQQLTTDGEPERTFSMKIRGAGNQDQPQSWIGHWFNDTHIGYTLVEDKRGVSKLMLVNSLTNPAPQPMEYSFELPGDKQVIQYEMWLIDADNGKAVRADIDKFKDQEVKLVYPLYGGDEPLDGIYFTRKNRVGDTLELCRLNPFSGQTTTLITEVSKPIVNSLLHSCTPIHGGRQIIWWSERTGKGAFYLYDGAGNLLNPITDGSFVAGSIYSIDPHGGSMILDGYGYNYSRDRNANPYYKQFFKVNLDGSGFVVLTPGDGEHVISTSSDKQYLIDRYSTVERMPRCEIRDMAGRLRVEIPLPDEKLLLAHGWNSPRLERVKAADLETDLFGILFFPPDFDPAKKYPVICNVYPGPQMDGIPLTFSLEHCNNATLAKEGFIVLQFGYRGSSPLRGRDFYTYGYGNLRDYPLADCKHVVEKLAEKYPCFDLDRVGIYGHSGGGFMSATAILTYPGFFKVAIASSGNHDNNIYGKFWTETYHGVTPTPMTDAYGKPTLEYRSRVATNFELADRLTGRLLLITGDLDNNVHPANTLRLANALIKNNKRFDLMIIPGAGHEMGGEYYNRLIRNYFVEHLKHFREFDANMR